MGERIELPPTLNGDEGAQLQQVWSYLYQTAEKLNLNLDGIGSNELTDAERAIVKRMSSGGGTGPDFNEYDTLKSLIIKTADYVQTSLQEYRMNLLGETVAEGKFGRYVRQTGLDVEVTPEGITQNYSFAEIVQGLQEYKINAKNYIKTGLLRTVSSIPVYGVAIGKDVVTFSQDGTETYNDGNKVAELTADELSFYQNSVKIASYKANEITLYAGSEKRVLLNSTGLIFYKGNTKLAELTPNALEFFQNGSLAAKYTASRIGLYNGGTEVMYIENGKIYSSNNLELNSSKNVKIGDWTLSSNGLTYDQGTGANRKLVNIEYSYNYLRLGYHAGSEGGEFLIGVKAPKYTLPADKRICIQPFIIDASEGYFSHAEIEELHMPAGDGTEIDAYPISGAFRVDLTDENSNTGTFTFGLQDWVIATPTTKQPSFGTEIVLANEVIGTRVGYGTLHQLSSREKKHDITDLEDCGEKIDRLRPVRYVYNGDKDERERLGLIHEETIDVLPEICWGEKSAKAEHKSINYVELIPVLLKEIQSLRARVKALEEKVNGEE